MILRDVLGPDLRVVFCGTAAGTASARVGAYYAGPGNAFWATLHEVGLTPRRLRPEEYLEVLRYGIGLTDMCKVRSGSDSAVGASAFDVSRLIRALEQYELAWLAFNGKNAKKGALERPVAYGEQRERLGPSRLRTSIDLGRGPAVLGPAPVAGSRTGTRRVAAGMRRAHNPGLRSSDVLGSGPAVHLRGWRQLRALVGDL